MPEDRPGPGSPVVTIESDIVGADEGPSPDDDSHRVAPTRHAPEEWIGALAMALLVAITLANVIVRYLTNRSFAWTEEISVFVLVILTLAGSAWAASRDAHIRIEYFYQRGRPSRRRALAVISGLATACMFALLAVLAVRAVSSEIEFGETTMGLGVPRWWYSAWLPPLAAWVAYRALAWSRQRAKSLDRARPGEPS